MAGSASRRSLSRRWRELDRRAAAAAALLMPVTQLLLKAQGLGPTRAMYHSLAPVRARPLGDPRRIARGVDAVAMRWSPERTCLARALVLELVLRRRGFEPVLRVGVDRSGDALRAHAWVELDDAVLGRAVGPFAPLGTVP